MYKRGDFGEFGRCLLAVDKMTKLGMALKYSEEKQLLLVDGEDYVITLSLQQLENSLHRGANYVPGLRPRNGLY